MATCSYGISYVTNTDCKQQTKDLLGVVNGERTRMSTVLAVHDIVSQTINYPNISVI